MAAKKPAPKPARKPATKTTAKPAGKSAAKTNVSKDELLHFYREMLMIRRFEEKAGQLYGMGLIGGFCHLYIGQEAVVVGLEAAASEGDKRITSYRDHGHMLACGMDPKGVMAELTGREGGYSKGKGGSMHMFSKEAHFYGGHGIVAAQVPIGAGLAFSDKYKGNDRVTFTYFGDGAANQGQVAESYNMAELWDLPVIFVIENNQYAMGTSVKRATKSPDFWERGAAYGIEGEAVDGMSVLAVKEAGEKAVAHCRAGKGPYILEVNTYRYRGHSMSDPAKYRTREEVQKMRSERDPIEGVRDMLLTGKHATDADLKAIDKEIKDIVNAAAEFAKESPEPDVSELWTDIYAAEAV
jgi:pyruvate dehydrogenase E1 component alpha subunit